MAADSGIRLHLVPATIESGTRLIRDEMFDLIVIHEDQQLDATKLIGPMRTAAPDQLAIVVLADSQDPERCALCLEAGADEYLSRLGTHVRTLLWRLARAVERQRLLSDFRSTQQRNAKLQKEDYQDAIHQLRSQRRHTDRPFSIQAACEHAHQLANGQTIWHASSVRACPPVLLV